MYVRIYALYMYVSTTGLFGQHPARSSPSRPQVSLNWQGYVTDNLCHSSACQVYE